MPGTGRASLGRRWSSARGWWRVEPGFRRIGGRAGQGLAGDQEPSRPDSGPRRQGRAHRLHDGPSGGRDQVLRSRGRVRGEPGQDRAARGPKTRRDTARPGEPRAQSRPRRGTAQGARARSYDAADLARRSAAPRSGRRARRPESVRGTGGDHRPCPGARRDERPPDATPPRPTLRLRPRQLPGAPGGRPQAGSRRQSLREVAPGLRPRHGGGSGATQEEWGGAPVKGLEVLGIEGFPEVRPGDDLKRMIQEAVAGDLRAGDVLVVTHKIVSKAEGRLVDLRTIEPSALAKGYATRYGKDPRQIEVVLRESRRIVRMDRGIVISETHHGFVCANAGVDASNVPGDDIVCLLPIDPDASATRLRDALARDPGIEVSVIISDSFGRAWRHGITDVAIGVAGMDPVADYRGQRDPHGFPMEASVLAIADELAAAAELVMGKTDGIPLAIVRGYSYSPASGSARELLMPPEKDMFR